MQTITTFDNTAESWERSLYAFLTEAEPTAAARRTSGIAVMAMLTVTGSVRQHLDNLANLIE